MHWKAKPPSHALSTKRKIAISGCSRPCSTAKKRSHFSNRMESDPFPPHQGNDPIVGKCIFSFENDRIAPGVTWCVSHHKANELQALPKRASIPRLSESSKSKTPSRQNSTMVLPMKFLAMPSRKIWNGSFLKNLPAPPVFQSSNGICLNGGGTLQGGVAYKVSVHVGLLDTSSKGYASSPALHSWQHGMKFLCPTFWYDRLSTPVLAWYSISPDMPSTAIWNKVSPTEMPSQQAVLRSTDVASKRDWRRPGVVLNFFEGKANTRKWVKYELFFWFNRIDIASCLLAPWYTTDSLQVHFKGACSVSIPSAGLMLTTSNGVFFCVRPPSPWMNTGMVWSNWTLLSLAIWKTSWDPCSFR